MRSVVIAALSALLSSAVSAQSPEPSPAFVIADVHIAAKAPNAFSRAPARRAGHYEFRNASMVNLISMAYGFDPDKVLGGPSWLEMERYDIIAKLPPDSTPDTQQLMLRALLEDRFKLTTHKDTKPLPTYALVQGAKPKLKEADGSGDTGCKPQSPSGPPAQGGVSMFSMNGSAPITLGPGMTIQYACRNMSMTAFAAGLRNMMGASLGPNPVLDQTGIKGDWNFEVKWSMQLMGPMAAANASDRITIFDALEKQLGLRLEERQVPTPVIIVDSVSRKPSDNPPGFAEALPPVPVPTEFEVADIKPTDPNMRMPKFQLAPGGRLVAQGMTMRFLMNRAFNTNNNDSIVGIPKTLENDRYDITAKAASAGPATAPLDNETVSPMLRALFVDRFKMTYHTEERPLPAYNLVAAKPKMKKADPASRTHCINANAPASAAPGSRMLTCQNISMQQFADQLLNTDPALNFPVLDKTEIEGGWDFTLIYSQNFGRMMMMGPGRGGDAGPAGNAVPNAEDPTGGVTIFQAIEKQLGLKLEMQKRSLPVIVIDHMESKPTDN